MQVDRRRRLPVGVSRVIVVGERGNGHKRQNNQG
jgi:hypothetical protein